MTMYRSFYPRSAEYAVTADSRHFPLRDRLDEAVKDAQDAWHKGHTHGAIHLVPYRIENGTATELQVRIHRRMEVEVAS